MIRNRIYDLFFLSFLFVVVFGVSQLLAPFSGAMLSALVCAIMFHPLFGALRRWLPHHRPTALALIASIFVLIVFVTPMILLTWAVIQESSYLAPVIKQWNVVLDQLRHGEVTASLPGMAHLQRILVRGVGMTPLQFQENIIDRVSKTLEAISGWGPYVAHRALFFLFDLFAMFFILFFLFRDGDKWLGYIHDLIPMNRSDKEHLLTRIENTVVGVSRGWLLTGLIQGLTAMVVYLAVGIEGAVLLGVLTAFLGLVPGVGTVAIWIPVSIFLFAKGLYWKSAFVMVWGALIVVGLIDTVARPSLIGKKVELPLFVLFFALLGGIIVWGAKGVIIGPILVAITPVLLDIYRDRYLRHAEVKAATSAMKILAILTIGLNIAMSAPLQAESPGSPENDMVKTSANLEGHKKTLEQMQAVRQRDSDSTDQAEQDLLKGKAEMAGHKEQLAKDIEHLKSVESQVANGKNTHQSHQVMAPLLQSRRTLKVNIHQGGRQVHNDKTLLGIQKRSIDSNARYIAIEDRKIQKVEKHIAADRKAISDSIPP